MKNKDKKFTTEILWDGDIDQFTNKVMKNIAAHEESSNVVTIADKRERNSTGTKQSSMKTNLLVAFSIAAAIILSIFTATEIEKQKKQETYDFISEVILEQNFYEEDELITFNF